MTDRPPRLGLFPGTFDPITNGHLDIIRRGRGLFDQLVVAVGDNPEKHSLLNANERAAIIREVVADMDNVRVEIFTGLTVDLARRLGATAILRGLRNTTDLHFEFQVALTNRVVASIETIFVITATEWAFTSSSLIRQIARMGGDVSAMVPPQVVPHLQSRCGGGEDHALIET